MTKQQLETGLRYLLNGMTPTLNSHQLFKGALTDCLNWEACEAELEARCEQFPQSYFHLCQLDYFYTLKDAYLQLND